MISKLSTFSTFFILLVIVILMAGLLVPLDYALSQESGDGAPADANGLISAGESGGPAPSGGDGDSLRGPAPPGSRESEKIVIPNPLEVESFSELVNNVTSFLFNIAIIIAPIMILVGAFMFITAAGNEDRVKKGKQIIIWTLIGIAIVLVAQGLVALIKNILSGGS